MFSKRPWIAAVGIAVLSFAGTVTAKNCDPPNCLTRNMNNEGACDGPGCRTTAGPPTPRDEIVRSKPHHNAAEPNLTANCAPSCLSGALGNELASTDATSLHQSVRRACPEQPCWAPLDAAQPGAVTAKTCTLEVDCLTLKAEQSQGNAAQSLLTASTVAASVYKTPRRACPDQPCWAPTDAVRPYQKRSVAGI